MRWARLPALISSSLQRKPRLRPGGRKRFVGRRIRSVGDRSACSQPDTPYIAARGLKKDLSDCGGKSNVTTTMGTGKAARSDIRNNEMANAANCSILRWL